MALIQRLADIFNPSTNVVNVFKKWPPDGHDSRIAGYHKYQQIFDGDHITAFQDSEDLDHYGVYVVCNVGALIVKAINDLLFGEELTLEYPEGTSEKDEQLIQDIWDRNDLQTLCYENGLDTMVGGDGLFNLKLEESKAIIESAQVTTWCPDLNPDNKRIVEAHVLGWKRTIMDGQKKKDYLRMVIHEKGKIVNTLWEMEGTKLKREVGLDTLYDEPPPEEEETPIDDDFLIVHVPNFRTARDYYGRSEFVGMDSLFSALNARLSQIDFILTQHADPTLQVPADVFYREIKSDGTFDKRSVDVLPKGENGEDMSYTTWDGQIGGAQEFIDGLLDKILLVTETARQLVGIGDSGIAESGRALKYRLMRTLAKVNRKRNYYNYAIPKVLELAQRLEGVKDPVRVKVQWPDGLPQDIIETIEAEERKLSAGLTSKKRAIKRVENVDDEDAEGIMQEIDEEDDQDTSKLSNRVMGAKQKAPNINVNMEGLEEV